MFYVIVPHKYGHSYLMVCEENHSSKLVCKYKATRFATINEAYDGACYLQECPIRLNSIYGWEYKVVNENGEEVKHDF